jgi:hypothetical protein
LRITASDYSIACKHELEDIDGKSRFWTIVSTVITTKPAQHYSSSGSSIGLAIISKAYHVGVARI